MGAIYSKYVYADAGGGAERLVDMCMVRDRLIENMFGCIEMKA
jgi:hypothetical protein